MEDQFVDAIGLTLRTSSLLTDPEAWFDVENPGDYSVFGIHYILMPSNLRPKVPATFLASRGPYDLWSVGAPGLVQVADTQYSIAGNASDLGGATKGFLESALPAEGIYPTMAFAGAPPATPTLRPGEHASGPAGTVISEVDDLTAGGVTAIVHANRTAVVVLKAAYDPGWSATVDGVRTPIEMVAPALVAVKVTRGVHTVVFQFSGSSSYPELFAVALLTLLGVAIGPRLWRRHRARLTRRFPFLAGRSSA
jgi:Bacterial membrane protein YfhO